MTGCGPVEDDRTRKRRASFASYSAPGQLRVLDRFRRVTVTVTAKRWKVASLHYFPGVFHHPDAAPGGFDAFNVGQRVRTRCFDHSRAGSKGSSLCPAMMLRRPAGGWFPQGQPSQDRVNNELSGKLLKLRRGLLPARLAALGGLFCLVTHKL